MALYLDYSKITIRSIVYRIPVLSIFRIAILGKGFFIPNMQKVDEHFGLYESWNSVWGYLGYYFLILLLIVIPIVTIVVWNLV